MDLQQDKLTKSEWESIEIPSSQEEKNIYKLIIKGFHNVNIKENEILSILSFLKLSNTELINNYIFMKYLQPNIQKIYKKYNIKYKSLELSKKNLNKADIIRFDHMEKTLLDKRLLIFDFVLIDYIENILRYYKLDENGYKWIKYLYTLKILLKYDIKFINKHLLDIIHNLINYFDDDIDKSIIIKNAKSIIISNTDLYKYNDKTLFLHQKDLFTRMKTPSPKIVFYIAPTGTGKTLSPLGLSEKYKIIFVCAVRHVGLALAKAAITMEKCVAFAFGCDSVEDIRLHYFSAKEYTKNRKTGGIFKVDNSVGDKVEIMICDIKSYLHAMRYMLAFNNKEKIILYWDEPTISLDYKEHAFHSIIKSNWTNNEIENIVLSSATLPSIEELNDTINNYKERFGGDIYSIKNYDCSKSIGLVNRDGYIEAPHYISNDYTKIVKSAKYIDNNRTILRYVDLEICVDFITYINNNKLYKNSLYDVNEYFTEIEAITITSIKIYYLTLLRNIKNDSWKKIYNFFIKERKQKYKSTTYISTSDAATLVNGPTIYITQEVDKIAHFCIQCMKFPENIIKNITITINKNSDINKKILLLEKDYEDGIGKEDMKDKKSANERGISPELRVLKHKIESLKNTIKTVSLPDMYIPNKKDHLFKWGHSSEITALPLIFLNIQWNKLC